MGEWERPSGRVGKGQDAGTAPGERLEGGSLETRGIARGTARPDSRNFLRRPLVLPQPFLHLPLPIPQNGVLLPLCLDDGVTGG